MRRLITWLFHALLITVPFAFTAINEELFEFNKMVLVYGFATAIVGAWIARMVLERRIIFRRTPLFWPILLFLASQIISTVASIHPATSIFGYYSRFHGGLLSTFSYIALYFAAVSNFDRRDVLPMIRSAVLAGVGAALYALPEHFGVSPSCILISGEFSVACWVQDVRTRVFGTFGQPNWLAAYLLVLLPLTLWLWTKEKTPTYKKLSVLAFPLFFTVLLFTGSRSGFLGFFAGIVAFLAVWLGPKKIAWFQQWWKIHRRPAIALSHQQKTVLTIVAGSVLIASLLFGSPYSPSIFSFATRFQTAKTTPISSEPTPTPVGTVLDTGGTHSGEIRRIVWTGAIAVWRRYPLLGSGVETFAYSYYQDRPVEHNLVSEWDFLYNKAHNEFLNILATTGIVGLGSLLVLMGSFIWWLVRRRDALSLALLVGYTGLAVSNFFGFSTVMVGVLFFLMKAWFFLSTVQPEEASPQTAAISKTARRSVDSVEIEFETRHLAVGLTWLGTGILLLMVWRIWQNDALLARAKRQVVLQQPGTAYQMFQALTARAPNESLYWDEKSLFLANLAAAAASTDATLAAQLASEAAAASDQTIALNPVHLTYWKTRAKVFLYLSTIDARSRELALQALDETVRLAPTDPKNLLNRALILKDLGRLAEAEKDLSYALELKPNYDVARGEWEKLQQLQASSSGETL